MGDQENYLACMDLALISKMETFLSKQKANIWERSSIVKAVMNVWKDFFLRKNGNFNSQNVNFLKAFNCNVLY